MAVITITISDSPFQVVQGIPQTVTVTSNVSALIFYTLDGSDPTVNSNVVVGPILLPTDGPEVVLKVFATDGVDSSSVVESVYKNSTFSTLRRPRDTVDPKNTGTGDLFPFGSNSPPQNIVYGNMGGQYVSTPGDTSIPDGYNGAGGIVGYSDQPAKTYEKIYSETDSEGRYGRFLGNLPARVRVRIPPPPPTESQENSLLFNAKALVIYQDGTKPPVNPGIAQQNRQFFSLDKDNTKDGAYYWNVGQDSNGPTGAFLKQHYNPVDDTITFYYYDNQNLRWIISKERMPAKGNPTANLAHIVNDPRAPYTVGKVYRWIPFKRQSLP